MITVHCMGGSFKLLIKTNTNICSGLWGCFFKPPLNPNKYNPLNPNDLIINTIYFRNKPLEIKGFFEDRNKN